MSEAQNLAVLILGGGTTAGLLEWARRRRNDAAELIGALTKAASENVAMTRTDNADLRARLAEVVQALAELQATNAELTRKVDRLSNLLDVVLTDYAAHNPAAAARFRSEIARNDS